VGDITNDRANRKYGWDHQPPEPLGYSWFERNVIPLLDPHQKHLRLMPKRKWDWKDHDGLIVFACLIGGISGLFIFAFIADLLDQNGLLQPVIDYCNAFGAFVALHKTVIVGTIVGGIGGIVAVRVLFTLPHAIGWIAGRLAMAMREGFEKGLHGKAAGKFSSDPRARD
jgi:hypothetical protein